jgi:tetratricopeptide (TPR) repeat protein
MLNEDYEDYLEMARSLLGGHESSSELWEANEYVNLALQLRPDDPEGWIVKSQILSSLEDDPAALAAAEMAIRMAPRKAETHYVRAAVMADMDRHEDALEGIERAFQLVASDDDWMLEDLYYEKAAILDAIGRSDEALATFQAGLERCPRSTLLSSGLEPLRRERIRQSFQIINGGRQ